MKARVFPHILEAQSWNREVSAHVCHGADSLYLYAMLELSETDAVDKPTYAAAKGVQRYAYDEEGNEVETAEYLALGNTLVLPKVAVVVGDAFNTTDEEGNIVEPEWLEDITDLLPNSEGV